MNITSYFFSTYFPLSTYAIGFGVHRVLTLFLYSLLLFWLIVANLHLSKINSTTLFNGNHILGGVCPVLLSVVSPVYPVRWHGHHIKSTSVPELSNAPRAHPPLGPVSYLLPFLSVPPSGFADLVADENLRTVCFLSWGWEASSAPSPDPCPCERWRTFNQWPPQTLPPNVPVIPGLMKDATLYLGVRYHYVTSPLQLCLNQFLQISVWCF